MKHNKVVILRSNPVNPYPAVEKLAQTLTEADYQVTVIGWDRASKQKEADGYLKLPSGNVPIVRFGIPAQFNGGFRKNLLPMVRFQLQLVRWLYRNRKTYNVIHSFDLDTGLVGCIVAKIFGKRFVYQIFSKHFGYERLKRFFYNK